MNHASVGLEKNLSIAVVHYKIIQNKANTATNKTIPMIIDPANTFFDLKILLIS